MARLDFAKSPAFLSCIGLTSAILRLTVVRGRQDMGRSLCIVCTCFTCPEACGILHIRALTTSDLCHMAGTMLCPTGQRCEFSIFQVAVCLQPVVCVFSSFLQVMAKQSHSGLGQAFGKKGKERSPASINHDSCERRYTLWSGMRRKDLTWMPFL